MKSTRTLALITIFLLCFNIIPTSHADVHVRGYYRKDGTYVQPHMRSNPDGNFSNNYSTKGNVNPYTGEEGTKTQPEDGTSSYSSPSSSSNNSTDSSSGTSDNTSDSSPVDNSNQNNVDTGNTDSLNNDSIDLNSYQAQLDSYIQSLDDTISTLKTLQTDIQNGHTYSDNTSNGATTTDTYLNDETAFINPDDTVDEMMAKSMLVQYFNDVNEQYYKEAYSLWDSSWQATHPYDKFEAGYAYVTDKITNLVASNMQNGDVQLEIDLDATEGTDEIHHSYHIVYEAKDENGEWILIKGQLK